MVVAQWIILLLFLYLFLFFHFSWWKLLFFFLSKQPIYQVEELTKFLNQLHEENPLERGPLLGTIELLNVSTKGMSISYSFQYRLTHKLESKYPRLYLEKNTYETDMIHSHNIMMFLIFFSNIMQYLSIFISKYALIGNWLNVFWLSLWPPLSSSFDFIFLFHKFVQMRHNWWKPWLNISLNLVQNPVVMVTCVHMLMHSVLIIEQQ